MDSRVQFHFKVISFAQKVTEQIQLTFVSSRYANLTAVSSDLTSILGTVTEQISVLLKSPLSKCEHVRKKWNYHEPLHSLIVQFDTENRILCCGTETFNWNIKASSCHFDWFSRQNIRHKRHKLASIRAGQQREDYFNNIIRSWCWLVIHSQSASKQNQLTELPFVIIVHVGAVGRCADVWGWNHKRGVTTARIVEKDRRASANSSQSKILSRTTFKLKSFC